MKALDRDSKGPDTAGMSKLISITKAQAILCASFYTIKGMIERGDIRTVDWGKHPLLKLTDVLKMKKQRG